MENTYKISSIIDSYISGDWGNDCTTDDTPYPVYCVRGADIVPISNSQFNDIPLRYVSKRSFQTRCLQEGDIIIEKSGGSPTQSTGRVVYVSKELLSAKKNSVCSNFCTAFRVKEGWNAHYVFLYLQNVYNSGVFFNFEGKTSGLKNLMMDAAFKSIPIKKIPIAKQTDLTDSISAIDKKLSLNRQINDNLEAQLRLITSRYIFSCPNLEKKRIGEIATVKAGGDCPITFSKTRTQKCNIPIFSNGTEDRGLYGFTNKANIEGHSITIAARGTIGYCERRLMPFVPIIRLLAITPKEDGAYIYLHQVIRGMKFKKNGSVQQQLTVPEISFIEIPYPHSSVLHEYNKVASPIVEMIERNISENDILTKQRDELLPLLMNGQASVNYHLSAY